MELQSKKWINAGRLQLKWYETTFVGNFSCKLQKLNSWLLNQNEECRDWYNWEVQGIRYGWFRELKNNIRESILSFGSTFLSAGLHSQKSPSQIMTKMASKTLVSRPPGSATPKEGERLNLYSYSNGARKEVHWLWLARLESCNCFKPITVARTIYWSHWSIVNQSHPGSQEVSKPSQNYSG